MEPPKPLRVAMVCDMAPGAPGGSYISTARFAELLNERGHTAIIIGARDSHKPPVQKYRNIPFYQFFALPLPGSNRYYFVVFPRAKALRELFKKERIDVVHLMFPSYSCWLAARVAKKMGIPVIATCHTQTENIFMTLPKWARFRFMESVIFLYIIRSLRPGKIVVSPSELGKKILVDYDPSMHVEVISNGVQLSHFKSGPHEEHPGEKHILTVARFTPEKDIETLIRSMKYILEKNPATRLHIIGSGAMDAKLKDLSRQLGLEKYVSFLGRVSEEALVAEYNACDLFVLPSHVELEGMVVLEAMACGKPILIANSPVSASTYFVKNNGRLFEPSNPRDLAVKAVEILNDDAVRARMGEESYKDVQKYDIEKSVEKLGAVYRSVLS